MDTVKIDHDRCTLCGTCASVCVRQIFDDSKDKLELKDQTCILCGHCKAVCPENAIEIPSLNGEEFVSLPEGRAFLSPEKLLTFFRTRRSTRIYKKKAVEKEKMIQILEAGRFAPTGGNMQALRYIVVQTPEKLEEVRGLAMDALLKHANMMSAAVEQKRKEGESLSVPERVAVNYSETLKEMSRQHQMGEDKLLWNAPALMVTHVSRFVESPGVDVGLSAMQMVLMAEALGLGTCFIGFIPMAAESSPELKKALQIPDNHKTVTSFVTGYPDISYSRLVARKPARMRWL
jgi:nitroreductase/NAD-dependent dihydropyrimidine dehydrogenase PreA subunit